VSAYAGNIDGYIAAQQQATRPQEKTTYFTKSLISHWQGRPCQGGNEAEIFIIAILGEIRFLPI